MAAIGEKKEKIIGTVSLENGEYFLKIPRTHKAMVQGGKDKIALGSAGDAALKGLEDTKMEVLLSEPTSFVVGLVSLESRGMEVVKPKKILCYKPARDFLAKVTMNPEVIKEMTASFVDEGVISAEVSEILNAR